MELFNHSPKQAFNGLFNFSFLEEKPEPPKETTQDRLEDHCQHIAESITNGLKDCEPDEFNRWHDEGEPEDFTPGGYDYLDDVLDINYIVAADGEYRGAEILVGFGGPNIYVNTKTLTVEGYWWGDRATWNYIDNIGLDDACEELYQCSR